MTLGNLFPGPAAGFQGQSLTVDSSGKQFATPYTSPDVKTVVLDVRTDSVYVTFDGQTPSSTVGHLLGSGTSYQWSVGTFNAAKFTSANTTAYIYATPFQS